MRKYLGTYVDIYLQSFYSDLKGQTNEYCQLVNSKIQDLKHDPYRNSELMKGPHKGRRKVRINNSDRLVFIICEECRECGFHTIFRCSDCKTTSECTLIFSNILLGHDYKGSTRW
jgi:hypothetical protein